MLKTFRVRINWYGEVHETYTTASSIKQALQNGIQKLSKKFDLSAIYIRTKVLAGTDSYNVKEIKND